VNNINISGTQTPVLYEREQEIQDFRMENYHKLDAKKLDDLLELLTYVKKEQEEREARKARDAKREQKVKEEQKEIKKHLEGRLK